MPDTLRVGVIGAGNPNVKKSALGYAMAYAHADAYQQIDGCKIVAVADIVEENARRFAERYDVAEVFLDYQAMLKAAELDVLSICTWMHLHEPMVLDAIAAGVKVIHCEKPMADTWRGAVHMTEAAREAGVQLTFNHQRRYGEPFTMARQLLDDGAIGKLQRFECEFGNIYDTGTHFIDMLSFYQHDQAKAQWVLAQIDYRRENRVFGAHCENQQLLMVEYDSGVFGFVYSGKPGSDHQPLGVTNRLIGTEGVIDVGLGHGSKDALRWRRQGETEWTHPDTDGASIHGPDFIERAVADVIDCYRTGRDCQLSAEHALVATEIIFGAYESSRRRARVDFPLDPTLGNPLRELVEAGEMQPVAKES